MTAVTTLTAGTLCVAGVVLGGLYFGQRRLIWIGQIANGAQFEASSAWGKGAELVTLSEEHVGLYFKPKKTIGAASPTIVYFHGNGDQLGYPSLHSLQTHVLMLIVASSFLLLLFYFFSLSSEGGEVPTLGLALPSRASDFLALSILGTGWLREA